MTFGDFGMKLMIRIYFPLCPVDGPLDPVPFSHAGSHGAVPRKCRECPNLFEGECGRDRDDYPIDSYRHLDHGPCPFPGPTDPLPFEIPAQPPPWKQPAKTVWVPRKCINCQYLKGLPIYDAVCTYESAIWGDCHRGLDWGDWRPPICSGCGVRMVLQKTDAHSAVCSLCDLLHRVNELPEEQRKSIRNLAKSGQWLTAIKEVQQILGVSFSEAGLVAEALTK